MTRFRKRRILNIALGYFKAQGPSQDHAHGHSQIESHASPQAHDHGPSSTITTTKTTAPMRKLLIEVDDTMRFTPASWSAVAGEPVRITLVNKGKVDHELVIGTEAEIVQLRHGLL